MSPTRTCIFAHICLRAYVHFHSPSVSTLAGFSCLLLNHESPAILPTSQHISARKLFATFFIQVSAVTAPLSLLASRLQRVSGSKHELVQGTWSAYQSTDVSVVQKRIKTIWKNTKVVSACHVGLRLHVGQDDWLKHGICIWLWQLIWTFVLFVSETICTVKRRCRNRKLAESCQTFASICLVAARYVSPGRSAYKNRVTNRVQGLRHNKL